MDIDKVWLDALKVGPRHRALDPDRIEALAESMAELGLQQPVTVFQDGDETVHLVAGLHRVEAAKKLGWEQIEASFIKMSPARREMWEIAENLFRVDLTKEQRDAHIRRYAELLKGIEAEEAGRDKLSDPGLDSRGQRKSPQQTPGIARRIAKETGISTRTVQRIISDNEPKPVAPAPAPYDPEEAYQKWASDMTRVWNRASQEWRERWLEHIETPVMDATADDLDIPEFLRRSAT